MIEQSEQKQLDIIDHLLKDNEVAYTKSKHFESALVGLSEILETHLVIYSCVYKDRNNKEYRLSHHFYSQEQKLSSLKHATAKIIEKDKTPLINKIYEEASEVLVTQKQFRTSFISDLSVIDTSRGDDYSLVIIPFFDNQELIGMLTYKANVACEIAKKYSALFNTISFIFRHNTRQKNAQVTCATYQMVLDLMPQRVFWKNRKSVYLGCNKAFSDDASLNCTEEIVGVTDFDIFPEQAELYRSDDANTMTTLEHLICSEEPQTHKNGQRIWLRTSKRPIIDTDDNVIGVVGTYDDITQLKGIQHELQKAKSTLENRVLERTKELSMSNMKLESTISELKSTQNQLIETEKMAALGGLVAGIAHEINTPLGIAVTSASNLEYVAKSLNASVQQGKVSKASFLSRCSELVDNSDLILRNLDRASELVRSFKMIAVDQATDEKRKVNLYKYLSDVVSAMAPKTSKKNIRILLTGDKNLHIETYPGTISQLTTNLIDNAFIHAFSDIYNGEIKISYRLTDNHLELTFQDNGVGMDDDTIKNIFEPFYTTKRGEGGTGLGLSVVYNLVTQTLGGSITCQSKPNEMTRFNISIPFELRE